MGWDGGGEGGGARTQIHCMHAATYACNPPLPLRHRTVLFNVLCFSFSDEIYEPT